jgi:large repetitive protein
LFTNLTAGTYTISIIDANNCTASSTAIIGFTNGPTFASVATTNNTCGLQNGTISITSNGGTGVITYNANAFTNTTGNFTNLVHNTYAITITDANNCSQTSSVIIAEAPSPIITVAANPIACAGNTTTIQTTLLSGASTPIVYNINSGLYTTNNTFNNIAGGNYTVQAKDINNCITTSIINIATPTALTISNASSTIPTCVPGADASITTTATGGTGTLQYSINGGALQTISTFTNLIAGTYTILVQDVNNCTTTATAVVQPTPVITLTSVTSTTETCIPGNDATCLITINGGTLPINYVLGSTSQSTNSFANLSANTYIATITDANLCSVSTTVVIQKLANPIVTNLQAQNIICAGINTGTITSSGSSSSPITFTLLPNNISNATGIFNALQGGIYTVSLQDNNGCKTDTTATIIQYPSIQFINIASNNVSCFGNNAGSITASAIGASSIINYTILPSNNTNTTGNFTNLTAGNYTIQIQDSLGCNTDTNILITQPTALVLNVDSFANPLCTLGNTGKIGVTANGGTAPYTYKILPNNITNSIGVFTGLTSTTYTIVVTDNAQCTKSIVQQLFTPQSIYLSLPIVTNNKCFTDSLGTASVTAVGGAGGFTYQILPNNTINSTGTFTNLPANNYTIVSADNNGCTNFVTCTITSAPPIVANNVSIIKPICRNTNNGSITLQSSGGTTPYNYTINGNANSNNVFKNLLIGLYNIQITDSNNCKLDTLIEVQALNTFAINIDDIGPNLCIGQTNGYVSVSATGSNSLATYAYQLMPNNITNNTGLFNNLAVGVYTILVRDNNGCEENITINILDASNPISINIVTKDLSCYGTNPLGELNAIVFGGTAPYFYMWNQDSTLFTSNPKELAAGQYSLLVVDNNNCTAIDTAIVKPAPCCEVFVPNAFSPNGDNNNEIFIPRSNATFKTYSFKVFDRWGNQVYYSDNINKGWNGTYKNTKCDLATYYYVVEFICGFDNKSYRLGGDFVLMQ